MPACRRLLSAFSLVLLVLLTGCASFNMTKQPPLQSKPPALAFTPGGLSKWSDAPIGVYRVPESDVFISGHQKGAGFGMFFGLIGVAVENAVGSAKGKEVVGTVESALRIELTPQAQEIATRLLGSERFAGSFAERSADGSPELSVVTSVVATFVNNVDVRPYVVLKASMREPGAREPLWTTRYIASAGEARRMVGEDSWTSDDGARFKASVAQNLERAIKAMLTDVSGRHARDDNDLMFVQGGFPFIKQKVQAVGYRIFEDDDSIAFIPKVGDVIVFAGVNVMDKTVTMHRPATKEDGFKLLD
jgi:hypothetical protein